MNDYPGAHLAKHLDARQSPPLSDDADCARDAWEDITTAIRRMHDLANAAEYPILAELNEGTEKMLRSTLISLMLSIQEQADKAEARMKTVWDGLTAARAPH